jgi:hypothetical protein
VSDRLPTTELSRKCEDFNARSSSISKSAKEETQPLVSSQRCAGLGPKQTPRPNDESLNATQSGAAAVDDSDKQIP